MKAPQTHGPKEYRRPLPTPDKEEFIEAIRRVINCHSMEANSDTPDFILSAFLANVLKAYGEAVLSRDGWFGWKQKIAALEDENTALRKAIENLKPKPEREPLFLQVKATVRYWKDATVNGFEDELGNLIPLRLGDTWNPLIRLLDGRIMGWPTGTTARVHYKVCDEGEYRLVDKDFKPTHQWKSEYVPDDLLAGGRGYGDYIIVEIDKDGYIKDWQWKVDFNGWEKVQ